MSSIAFTLLQSSCKHQGLIRGGNKMCSFKDGKSATCWDDWQVCNSNNCFLINRNKPVTEDNQQSIFDYLEAMKDGIT